MTLEGSFVWAPLRGQVPAAGLCALGNASSLRKPRGGVWSWLSLIPLGISGHSSAPHLSVLPTLHPHRPIVEASATELSQGRHQFDVSLLRGQPRPEGSPPGGSQRDLLQEKVCTWRAAWAETRRQLRLLLKSRVPGPRAHAGWGVRGSTEARTMEESAAGTVPQPPGELGLLLCHTQRNRSHGPAPPQSCAVPTTHITCHTLGVTEMLCVRSQCVTLKENG